MRLFKSASQFFLFLWWGLISLFRDILNSIRSSTFHSYWTDEHLLYLVGLRHGGHRLHTAHFLSKCKHWPGVGFLHCTPQHLMEWHIIPPTPTSALLSMKKYLYHYFLFLHLKACVCLMKSLSAVFHRTTTNHYSLKYQCTETDVGS